MRAHEAANEAFDDVACEKLGINRTDLRCLNIVDNQGPMTAGRLADLSGLTTAAVTAVLDKDYPLIQGVVLVSALGYVLTNLLVDLSYSALDPRIRHREAAKA